jgi:hypothetical protein
VGNKNAKRNTRSLETQGFFLSEINKSAILARHFTSLDSTMYSDNNAAHREISYYFACRRRRIRKFHTACRIGRQEQKAREILRCVYPANPDGSKVVSLGLDPATNFEPIFNISKTGVPGVKFDGPSFKELCAKADFIHNHFHGATLNCGKLQISNAITISFLRTFGKPSIEFIAGVQSVKKRRVIIAAATWDCIYEMMPLLRHVFYTLTAATPHVKQLYGGIVRHTHSYCRPSLGPNPILQEVKSFLNSLDRDTFTKNVATDAEIDKFRVFHELVHFCLHDIASAVQLRR